MNKRNVIFAVLMIVVFASCKKDTTDPKPAEINTKDFLALRLLLLIAMQADRVMQVCRLSTNHLMQSLQLQQTVTDMIQLFLKKQ